MADKVFKTFVMFCLPVWCFIMLIFVLPKPNLLGVEGFLQEHLKDQGYREFYTVVGAKVNNKKCVSVLFIQNCREELQEGYS